MTKYLLNLKKVTLVQLYTKLERLMTEKEKVKEKYVCVYTKCDS